MHKIWKIIVKEIQEALPATIFFLVLFHMISLTKAVVLEEYSFTALRAVGATVGALIVAKAILIVETFPTPHFLSGRGIYRILWKTLFYGVVVLFFRFLEDLIHHLMKHEEFATAFRSTLEEVSWPLFIVLTLWILGGLLLYCIARELVRAIGRDKVKKILFDRSESL